MCTSLPQETHQNTFTLPSGGLTRADLVNCRVLEPKTNTQNRVASFEKVIKRVEEDRRRQDEQEGPRKTGSERVKGWAGWGGGGGVVGRRERQKKLSKRQREEVK